MTHLSDEQIIQFNEGNPHAFQAVFDCFRMRIFYFVKKMIDDLLTAEEITSDTFVKLYNLKGRFTEEIKIQAFLFITARNASLDFLKYRRRERGQMDKVQDIDELVIDFPMLAEPDIEAEVLTYVYKEIENLPKKAKAVFKLFYLEGLSTQEIARRMGISAQTVANQKTTALKHLRIKVIDRPEMLLLLYLILSDN